MRNILTVAVAALMAGSVYAQTGTVYKAGEEGVKLPVLTKEVKPSYTADAIRRRVQGTVEVAAVVRAYGTVGDVKVTQSLDPDLDEQAVNATRQWQFRPGTKDSKAVDVQVQIVLTFTLRAKK